MPNKPAYYYSEDGFIRTTDAPEPGCMQSPAICKVSTHGSASDRVRRRNILLAALNAYADTLEQEAHAALLGQDEEPTR